MTHTHMRATMERYEDFRRSASYRRKGHRRPDRSEIAGSARMRAAGSNRDPARSATPARPPHTPRWLDLLLKA